MARDSVACICQVYREGNRVADWTANYALSLSVGSHRPLHPSSGVLGLLLDDISGVSLFWAVRS